jgi:hypothetical protein
VVVADDNVQVAQKVIGMRRVKADTTCFVACTDFGRTSNPICFRLLRHTNVRVDRRRGRCLDRVIRSHKIFRHVAVDRKNVNTFVRSDQSKLSFACINISFSVSQPVGAKSTIQVYLLIAENEDHCIFKCSSCISFG